MTNDTIGNFLQYQNGEFIQLLDSSVPEVIRNCIRDAIAEDPEDPPVEINLMKAGAQLVEQYGCGDEGIDAYNLFTFWYVEHYGTAGTDARIVIKTLPDWLTFQAKWLSQVAGKIMKKGSWADWCRANLDEPEKESIH